MATPVRDEWLGWWADPTDPPLRIVAPVPAALDAYTPPGAASKIHTMAVRVLLFIFPSAVFVQGIGQIFGVISVESFLPAINTLLGAGMLYLAKRVFKTYMVGREEERRREAEKRRIKRARNPRSKVS